MINVTKTFLPPLETYTKFLERVWDNKWLTNRGELVLELEGKLSELLLLENSKIILMNNGTIPLQIALKLLGNGGEIITTPFSYVATTSAIVWENCTPVFIDIHPDTLTIDETKIESAITENTTCILATHVFGNPCAVEEIERIALKHNLKVIYDGAHAFGVTYKGKSIFEYGDITTCSFHATKLFHTGEGGAVFCNDTQLYHQFYYSHNFGHDGPEGFHGLGINAKMSELQAAMGLSVLPYFQDILIGRQNAVSTYESNLPVQPSRLKLMDHTKWNFSYFPLIFESEEQLLQVQIELKANDIVPRRYFYPSLNKLPYVNYAELPISEDISSRILCLPLFSDIEEDEVLKVCQGISSVLSKY